ncbi:ergothioneine biosynthesis protein EgtC [Rhodococcus coprophilus]|uniref:Gamma-glutamyl-hercynylcysteine sulfoxide hydrolase n=1 Tax=Rhodococcus coprophilus TaxID=38310 RepID=A0A2X4U5K5_9NOCA|nr:ergothioneine biosynthesis protein EgtC [Rhodococcus coprophilus]MBM7457845.1 glutamine amidotransferase [Rhodococcus coprophilus]SQI30468.1 Amidohydrolase EgtC [Rhodococcus coprophilus]
MCRHLGYLGPATGAGDLLHRGSNSLVRQSFAPRDMRGGGTINADGFGVGWWAGDGAFGRYRSSTPVWADPFVTEGMSSIRGGALMVALRSATEGMPVERSASAPFGDARWGFSLNGVVRGWPGSLAALASTLDVTELLRLEAPTDAATLWLLLRSRLRSSTPDIALMALVREIIDVAPESRLNMLLCNGSEMWATAWYHSLWTLADEDLAIVASEPYDDDPRWQPVPDRHLVYATPGKLIVTPLEVNAP